MKILFFIGSLQSGGAERVAVRLTDAFTRDLGWDTTLVTGDTVSNDFYQTEYTQRFSLGFDYDKSRNRSEQFSRVFKVRRYIQQESPDLVVFSSIDFSLRGLFSTLGLRIPKIVCEHNNYFAVASPKKRMIRNLLYPTASRVFLLTDRDLHNYPKRVQKKVRVVPNPLGVDGQFTERRFNKNMLAVGRLTEQKAFHRMLHVMTQLPDDYSLHIVGEGPLESELKTLANQLQIDNRVFFVGRRTDVTPYYREASLLLMTSLFEGLPMVIAEANAHALPVVSFDCETGPREMIEDEVSGYLVTEGNGEEMADKIRQLEKNDELYDAMCKEAFKRSKQYSMSGTLENWQREIGELLMS